MWRSAVAGRHRAASESETAPKGPSDFTGGNNQRLPLPFAAGIALAVVSFGSGFLAIGCSLDIERERSAKGGDIESTVGIGPGEDNTITEIVHGA